VAEGRNSVCVVWWIGVAEREKQIKILFAQNFEISVFIKLEHIFSLMLHDQLLKIAIFPLETVDGK
jgi:hypothetical protein